MWPYARHFLHVWLDGLFGMNQRNQLIYDRITVKAKERDLNDRFLVDRATGRLNIQHHIHVAKIAEARGALLLLKRMLRRISFLLLLVFMTGHGLFGQLGTLGESAGQEWERATHKLQSRYYQRSSLEWQAIPLEIPAVSGRLIPGQKDFGMSYLEERLGRIYKDEGLIREQIDSVSAAGTIRNFQWMAVRDLWWSWQSRYITIPKLSTAPLFSPLSKANSQLYIYEESGDSLLLFRPNQKNFHGLTGSLRKRKNGWELHWYLLREQGLRLADSVDYRVVLRDGQVSQMHFFAHFSTLKYQAFFQTDILLFETDKAMEDNWLDNCILRWTRSADTILGPSVNRPYPLSSKEQRVLENELHYQEFKGSTAYEDSVRQFERQYLYVTSLLTGGRIATSSNAQFEIHPLWQGLGLNTVEGIYYVARPIWVRKLRGKQLKLYADLRYAFGAEDFRWKSGASYAIEGKRNLRFLVEGGHYVSQFNKLEPIQPLWNSVYTVFGDNFLKMFEKDYLSTMVQWEPIAGLTFRPALEYAMRSPLYNLPNFRGELNFTPNNPFYPDFIGPEEGFERHRAFTFSFDFSYQLGQRFRINRGERIDEHSNLPKVYAEYRKGLPILGAVTDFDFLTIGFGSETDWGSWGFSKADLSLGGFYSDKRVEFIDFKHFNGIQTLFLQSTLDPWSSVRQFGTLPYYDFSTSEGFVEFHLDHDFRGSLWKEMPWVGQLNWSFIGGANYLYTEEYGHFTELFFGLDRIFGLFRVQVMAPLPRPRNARFPMRFGMTIRHDFYWKNRRR